MKRKGGVMRQYRHGMECDRRGKTAGTGFGNYPMAELRVVLAYALSSLQFSGKHGWNDRCRHSGR